MITAQTGDERPSRDERCALVVRQAAVTEELRAESPFGGAENAELKCLLQVTEHG